VTYVPCVAPDPIIAEVRKAREDLGRMMMEQPKKFQALMRDIKKDFRDNMIPLRPRWIRKSGEG
jgi:hypothetical protein